MSHTPHELAEEFPDQTDLIHTLKQEDAHFARLADEYHEVNREVHRIETGLEGVSPVHETDLRKKRMALKDKIAAILAKAR